jgi:hypothetical protein
MKKVYFGIIAILFALNACQKDSDPQPNSPSTTPVTIKDYTIYGSLQLIPLSESGVLTVQSPDGAVFEFPKEYSISGYFGPLGNIDNEKSKLTNNKFKFNAVLSRFESAANIQLVSMNGSSVGMTGITIIGSLITKYENTIQTSFSITSGTGLYTKAKGWMTSTGILNSKDNTCFITPTGELNIR